MKIWKGVKDEYNARGKSFHDFEESDVQPVIRFYWSHWEKLYLSNLVKFLKTEKTTFDLFCNRIKQFGSDACLVNLKMAMSPNSTSSKIFECFMRDWLNVDSFPIDSNVREVLRTYEIPDDSALIRDCIRELNLDPKYYARAVFDLADELKLAKIIP